MKRSREEDDDGEHASKVRRVSKVDRLSRLSDELLVRILSFVPVASLLTCQRVSRKLGGLATDSELWKAAYYRKFVLPRASRIPGIKEAGAYDRLCYSSRLSQWLDDGNLVKDGAKTNWKQQYRLRHNWSQGQCAVSEIVVAEQSPDPPLLVMMSNSTVFAADSISGLRAWSSKNKRELLASTVLVDHTNAPQLPTSMAIDGSDSDGECEKVVLGFEDGSFSIFSLDRDNRKFESLFTHPPSSNGTLSALAYSSPYLLTMTEDHLLSLYAFREARGDAVTLKPPHLLYSLRSHTAWPPVSLSLRTTVHSVTAAIAYSLPTYFSGWTVGVQELRLSHKGEVLESRLATAADEHSFTLSSSRSASSPPTRPSSSPFPATTTPTSISYSHPYLLTAHPDNTLSLHLVKSTSTTLSISPATRLWGHTSSISCAHVGTRGKAVSVSRRGDDLRLWHLEGASPSRPTASRERFAHSSVRVLPSRRGGGSSNVNSNSNTSTNTSTTVESAHGAGLRFALAQARVHDSAVCRGWVGFDEQNVVVLREKREGSLALGVYDFS